MRPREQVDPVREQQDDCDQAQRDFFRPSELLDAQSGGANYQNGESVGVEDRQSAQEKKDERVPFPRTPEIRMEKGDG